MADTDIQVLVNQDTLRSESEGVWADAKGSKRGEICVIDFLTEMALEGRIYQVRIGTVTTPVTGDILVTDTKAEACADAQTGTTIMPVYFNVCLESFAGGTLPEAAAKSVPTVSTSGAVFVPLPLYIGGNAAMSTARVAVAGGVVLAAEVATTTRVHFINANTAQADRILADHVFTPLPVLVGAACFYVQVSAATAGPVYFGHFDYIELPSTSIT